MRVSVFGMGYVGVVSGACLAGRGHEVIGVDVSKPKLDMLRAGQSPIVEERIDALVAETVAAGRLRATDDVDAAVEQSELSLVSVGTPSQASGAPDLSALRAVAGQIGAALARKADRHVVVVRSTTPPGTTRDVVIPALEAASGRRCGTGFDVAYNPEFLREGSSVRDFEAPPFTVIGEERPGAGDRCAALYEGIDAPVFRVPLEVAEALKYACNAFHAAKVAFANEIGALARAQGLDGRAVMDLLARDTKLNASAAYLKPGFAFGGSCLPKDVRALSAEGRRLGVALPLLDSLLVSNERHLERAVRMVLDTGERDVALLGLAFKAGTDDLRESPLVALAERLLGKGCRLRIHDREVSLARLLGANRAFIEREIPHLGELLAPDLAAATAGTPVVVLGAYPADEADAVVAACAGRTVIALCPPPAGLVERAKAVHGICW